MVTTRFAPSPTSVSGGLHIGGLRTALFSYLFAKNQRGNFVLRIEDTDEARSTKESYTAIVDDMLWAGLKWDFGPSYNPSDYKTDQKRISSTVSHFQSDNKSLYSEFFKSNRHSSVGEDGSVRIKDPYSIFGAPKEEAYNISFFDGLLGQLICPLSNIEKFVLIKSSGMPSFYTACSLDDSMMGVTHVIRGQEHINSTFRQLVIYKALGLKTPSYTHIPLIMNQDGSKMSKRQTSGQVNVIDFRKDGYTPLGVLSYIVSLGSSVGGTSDMTMQQMISDFALQKLTKASAKFDYNKLDHINSMAMKNDPDIVNTIKKFAEQYHPETFAVIAKNNVTFDRIVPAAISRSKNMKSVLTAFLDVVKPSVIDDTVKAKMHEKHNIIVSEVKSRLEDVEDWSKTTIMDRVNSVAKVVGIKFGEVAQALRIATTGKTVSPPIDDVLFAIGKEEVISRLSGQN